MVAIESGTVIAGRYRLEALVAQGGMGAVWSARHLTLDTRLALKFIGPEVADLDEARQRFEREAKVAALLHSPHVVQVLDYGVDAGLPYLAMELLEGEDLGARLAHRGRLSVPETVSLVTQMARALRRAADAGIVHRDLKPGNVFMVRVDEDDEVVKVLDFGVAKAPFLAGVDATRSGVIVGSPRYMSPEQVRGSRAVDHRGDLWSLAVIAYRALTGRLPFQGADVAEVIIAICSSQPPPPSALEPSLGPEMDHFFARALATAADDRFQSARDFARAFAAAAGEEPPPSISSSQLQLGRLARLALPSPPRPSPPRPSPPRPPPVVVHEPTCRSFAALPSEPAVAEPLTLARGSEPEGTLTSAPRSLEVWAPGDAAAAPRRTRLPPPGLVVGFALAVLVGLVVGGTVHPERAAVTPAATGEPALPSAAPAAPVAATQPEVAPSTAGPARPLPATTASALPARPSPPAAPAKRHFQKYVPVGI
jgi:serine/threonine-protein kinase